MYERVLDTYQLSDDARLNYQLLLVGVRKILEEAEEDEMAVYKARSRRLLDEYGGDEENLMDALAHKTADFLDAE